MKAWRLIAHFIKDFQRPGALFIGLILCLAAGVVIDRLSCFSGVMILSEGKNSCCLIQGTHVLSIQTTDSALLFVELASLHTSKLQAKLLNYTPNARQKLKCTRENQVTLFTTCNHTLRPTRQALPIPFNNGHVATIKAEHVGDVVADLSLQAGANQLPLTALIQEDKLTEYLLTIGQDGNVSLISLESLLKNRPIALDEGRQGYGIPISPNAYFKVWPTAVQLPSSPNTQDDTPCAHLCFTDNGQSEILSLTYDPTATSFRWPLFNGKYLVRYQPLERTMPCSLQPKGWTPDQRTLNMIYVDSNSRSQEIALTIGEPYLIKDGYKFTLLKTDSTAIRIAVEYSMMRKIWNYLSKESACVRASSSAIR